MTNPDADESLVRSAFRDLRGVVPNPAPTRLETMEATVRRRRRRRATGLVATGALATALVVTPAVLAGGEPADTPAAPPSGSITPPVRDRPPTLGTCPVNAARQGADLSVAATDIAMGQLQGEQPNTRRRGDMAITVCNAGRVAAPAGTLTLRWLATIPPDDQMGSGSWKDCRPGEQEREPAAGGGEVTYNVVNCGHPELPSGSSWKHMFLFEMPGDADPGFDRPLVQYAEVSSTGDVNTGNNRATFKVRSADPVGTVSQPARRSCSSKTSRQGADLSVVATALTLGPQPQGNEPRRGDIIITVCNNGRVAAPAGTLTLRWLATIPPDDQMGTGSWEGCRYGEQEREPVAGGGEVTYTVVNCSYATLAPGASRRHMFLFEIPGGVDPGIGRPVTQYAQVSKNGDANTRNNRATFKIATV